MYFSKFIIHQSVLYVILFFKKLVKWCKEYTSPYDEDPKDIRAIGFLPDGDVLDGNVYRDSIIDILNGYRA